MNHGLNLSRSFGDFYYKVIPGIGIERQKIVAYPDTVTLPRHLDDEFIILGCDGVWDMFTNELVR